MATIEITDTLILDQSSGVQDDDTVVSNDLTGLSTFFKDFLLGLGGDLELSAGQLAYADDVEASVSGPALVTVTPDGGTISELFFSDLNGDPLDGDQVFFNGNPLQTVDGDNIYFHSFEGGKIVLATTSPIAGQGDVVAAFYLNAAGDNLSASIEMVTFEAIAHPDATSGDDSIDWSDVLNVTATGSTSFNFDNLDSGNHLFVAVGTADVGLVVSGLHPVIKADGTLDNSGDNIKTSQGGTGATIGVNNQMFDPGETAVFSFVSGQATGTFGDIDNMNYDDFVDVTDAAIFISQTEGSPNTDYTLKIGAFSAGGAGTNPEEGRSYIDNDLPDAGPDLGNDAGDSALADDTAVDIVRVVVKDETGQVVVDTTTSTSTVTFNADGTVTVSGLDTEYTVQVFTDDSGTPGTETFNRFQVTGVVGKFDVGRVDISQGVNVTQSVGDQLFVEDDGPTVTAGGTVPTLTTDDTNIPDTASDDFSTIFTAAFGTDGFKDSDDNDVQDVDALTYALGVKSAGVDSGLDDTLSGDNILLRLNASGEVEGYLANDTSTVAFVISVDEQTGEVTLTQNRSVVHNDPTDPEESGASAAKLAAADLVTLTATATDDDGDTDDATANIGNAFNFEDDGLTVTAEGTVPTLTTDDTDIPDTASDDFSTIFTATFGTDGFKDSDDNDVQDADAITYALDVKSAGVDSGLDDTVSGDNILLRLNASGEVEGYLANATSTVAFVISVDENTGEVTLTQNRSVVHNDPADPEESGASAAKLAAADLVTLTATATDGDGDTDDATANIGDAFNFEDDGLTVTADGAVPTLTTDDTDIPDSDSDDFSTIFTATFGTDGFKDSDDNDVQDVDAITYALGVKSAGVDSGLDDTLSGDDILLRLNASGEVEGYLANATSTVAFVISVDENTGEVTLTQNRSVVHDDPADPEESGASAAKLAAADLVTLTATATDGDGDTDDATANIGDAFNFEDDGPSVTADGAVPTLTTDDTDIPDTASDDFSTIFTATFGTDEFKDSDDNDVQDADAITYALDVKSAGVDSGLDDTVSGDNILLRLNASGEVEGYLANATSTVAFVISVDENTGEVTLTQNRSVVHNDPADPEESGASAAKLAAADLVTLTATATDGDGDTDDATANIGDAFNFEDDGLTVTADGAVPTLTTDDTDIPDSDSDDFSTIFTATFGTDGFKDSDDNDVQDVDAITYALGVKSAGVDSGLDDTLSGDDILLRLNASGEVEGYLANATSTVAFVISVDENTGEVTLTQNRSVVHDDPADPEESGASAAKLAAADLVTMTATATDGDGDTDDATVNIGDAFNFEDDGPTAELTEEDADVLHDETAGVDAASNDKATALPAVFAALGAALGWAASASAAVTPGSNFGADGDGGETLSLDVSAANADSGFDTLDGHNILLNVEAGGLVVGRVDDDNDGSVDNTDAVAIAISLDQAGILSVAQYLAIAHPDDTNPNDVKTMADGVLLAVVDIEDGDGDTDQTSIAIGDKVQIRDDGPRITAPFDGDQNAGNGNGTHETLANALNASATGAFGYDIGTDGRLAAYYTGGGSDFVDQSALAGVQIGLSGTIVGGGGGSLLTQEVTLASESPTSATFNFSFTYDKDPAAGVQTGTAGGTLVFDKVNDTYTITLTDPLEGFTFDVIHTSQLLSKEPTSNVGHPQIVVSRLQADDPGTPTDEDFYVQFTGNAITKPNPFSLTSDGENSSADSTFTVGGHEMVSNNNETWVSATQSTNGVAGDTIQKGELLTLRFFNSNVGIQSEALTPTATAGAMAIKFDGIGNSEDLMLILNLIDKNGADNIAGNADDNSTITRAVYAANADIFRTGQVPTPYDSEFTLDNNDGLLIIEQNDYNAAGEDYVLQGVQIMQSGNGITGANAAIDLTGATGAGGGSNATGSLVNFDAVDNDVLKITDIGFTSTVTETPNASLDFAFQLEDADGDQTAMQHILVEIA
ncbi:hypothetical protein IG197_29690 (plasmid) [Aminobacter sp. SR38]|uniref:DUF5801 repeats-in-toxin domain-containing protein n=1 Tax=Aminobacter sp. SR38 TaxID=2774562 RepID=UPI001784C159|nr:DUF5801 repeats-in-toxin domain-containing protein [Aminobacter sp. SR38]QOF74510.1 hypothetical protein IG197_29690 [Aminobacter sp. SR38]